MLKNDIKFQKTGNTMNKLNILLLMLLMVPVFTFLLFSKENTGTVVYLHEQTKTARSNQEHFNQFAAAGNVIIDFYADWCPPCRRLSPLIDAAAGLLRNVTFLKINRDYFKDLAQIYRVTSIPTLIFLRDGKEIARYDGKPLSEKELIRLVKNIYHI
jgi:thioredoxin